MTTRLANAPTEPQAFVAWENWRKARYELIGGEVRLMAGGSRAHDVVAGNILAALHVALRGRNCDVHGSNLKIVSPAGMVTYPDVFVRCGPLADECHDPAGRVRGALAEHPERRSGPQTLGLSGNPCAQASGLRRCGAGAQRDRDRAPDGRWWSTFLDRLDAMLALEAVGVELGGRRDLRLDPRRQQLTQPGTTAVASISTWRGPRAAATTTGVIAG